LCKAGGSFKPSEALKVELLDLEPVISGKGVK